MLLQTKNNSKVKAGDLAPDFTLPSQNGTPVRLHDFRGGKNVVLYFYPKDNTKYCIVESMTFRDKIEKFKEAEAVIMGISSDAPDSHVQFAREYKLPFLLLSDTDNKVRKRYGIPATFGLIPGRVTYVIDKEGVVRHVFSAQFDPKSHVKQALEALQSLS